MKANVIFLIIAATLAELLSENGYRTRIFGKWHLGDTYPGRPGDQGFQRSLVHKGGGIGQVGDLDNFHRPDSSYFNPVLYKENEPVRTRGYCTDVFTDGALEFMDQNRDAQFFLYLAFNAPHGPLQVPVQYSRFNNDTTINEITLPSCYFSKGRGMLEAYYRYDFGEIVSPLSLIIRKAE